jgi:hypothetical protein
MQKSYSKPYNRVESDVIKIDLVEDGRKNGGGKEGVDELVTVMLPPSASASDAAWPAWLPSLASAPSGMRLGKDTVSKTSTRRARKSAINQVCGLLISSIQKS